MRGVGYTDSNIYDYRAIKISILKENIMTQEVLHAFKQVNYSEDEIEWVKIYTVLKHLKKNVEKEIIINSQTIKIN